MGTRRSSVVSGTEDKGGSGSGRSAPVVVVSAPPELDVSTTPPELEVSAGAAVLEPESSPPPPVVPSPDPVRGFVPKAYCILAPGHAPGPETAASIFRFLRERVSGYKLVRRIEFSDLPKTISGKIRRVELRGHEQARPASGARSEHEYLEENFR